MRESKYFVFSMMALFLGAVLRAPIRQRNPSEQLDRRVLN